jgi:DNA repair protein RadA/Sms
VDIRISEAANLGFKRFVIPAGNLNGLKVRQTGLEIVGVKNVIEAMEAVFI